MIIIRLITLSCNLLVDFNNSSITPFALCAHAYIVASQGKVFKNVLIFIMPLTFAKQIASPPKKLDQLHDCSKK
jgi:hypothetical protein